MMICKKKDGFLFFLEMTEELFEEKERWNPRARDRAEEWGVTGVYSIRDITIVRVAHERGKAPSPAEFEYAVKEWNAPSCCSFKWKETMKVFSAALEKYKSGEDYECNQCFDLKRICSVKWMCCGKTTCSDASSGRVYDCPKCCGGKIDLSLI